MSYFTETSEGIVLNVRAQPRSSRSGIDGLFGDAVKVRIRCAPVDGKANAKLCSFLAERLGIPKNAVRLVSGETNRAKRFSISGIDAAAALTALRPDA